MGCTNSKHSTKDKKHEHDDDKPREDAPPEQPREVTHAAPETPQQEDVDVEEAASQSQAMPSSSKFKLAGPSVEGDVQELWKPHAYRIVNEDGWYIYSDTNKFELHFTFITKSDLEAGDSVHRAGEDHQSYKLKLYPGETKHLWKGEPNGWSYKASGVSLSEEYCARLAEKCAEQAQHDIDRMRALVNAEGNEEEALKVLVAAHDQNKFVDLHFPPSAASIGRGRKPTEWMRPEDFLRKDDKHKVRLISKGVAPNDIDQGRLGDCWFLCAVASLAEDPEKVKDIFRHPVPGRTNDEIVAEREKGAYHVTLNKGGWWEVLVLDDYLPCIGGTPCFAKNVEDPAELWVALLEKAYARVHGSYAAIAGGDALQALMDLTGYPAERFPPLDQDPEGLFERLLECDRKGYMINLNTPGEDDSEYMSISGAVNSSEFTRRYKQAGLGMGHAYSVLEVKAFPEHDHLRLVKIRNPWGNGTEWTGEWSDHSELWDKFPDVKQACNLAVEADGTFWMKWEDARTFFESGGVCFVERNWYDYRVRGHFEDSRPDVVLEMTVKKPTEVYFILSQRDRRGLDEDDPDHKYHAVMISLCERDHSGRYSALRNSNWRRLDQPTANYCYCTARDVCMKVTLEPHEAPYLVVPRSHPSNKAKKSFVLGMISANPVDDSDLIVNFVRPPADWRCYQNYTRFDYVKESCPTVSTEFQFNPERGCHETHTDQKLFTSVCE